MPLEATWSEIFTNVRNTVAKMVIHWSEAM